MDHPNKSIYPELLLDPRWQRKRLEIMQRDEFTCQCCLSTNKTLAVHHMKYDGYPWEVDEKFLITLCTHCHKLEEKCLSENFHLAVMSKTLGIPALYQLEILRRSVPDGSKVFHKNKLVDSQMFKRIYG